MTATPYRRSTRSDATKARIRDTIRDLTAAHGQPPTQARIAATTGLAQSTVAYQLQHMAEQGQVVADGPAGMARRYRVR